MVSAMHAGVVVALLFLLGDGSVAQQYPPPCDSQIYCYGDLLEKVQLAHLYNDSKTFVDMRQIYHPEETLQRFDNLMQQTGGNPTQEEVREFVESTFIEGDELHVWEPSDWKEDPAILQNIIDPELRSWASDLNYIWKNLSRRMGDEVQQNPDQYSIIYVPNGFVIPGGRFREFYYWDSYWIVQGLLLSEMYETTRGILENFLSMVDKYGFVPNGGRVYYLQRSQPPLLIPMVENYLNHTSDITFLEKNIDLLEKEFQFWVDHRTILIKKDGRDYKLARYNAESSGPRPESYREDFENANYFPDEKEKADFFINLKSAAESGWDFSSRWYISEGTNQGNLTQIRTKDIIPVDLNAFIYWDAVLLSKFFTILNNQEKALEYSRVAEEWKEAVTEILWNENHGTWLDYDILNNKPREYFYPSNLAPLWTKCYDMERTLYYAENSVKYINNETILSYLGGIPTSFELSREQWDFPNAWPPLQIIIIQGLEYTEDPEAKRVAYELASNWIRSNHKGYLDEKAMFEKYDAENPGKHGGGGEYNVQTGFGWTNGVIMELLNSYGKCMTTSSRTHLSAYKR